MTTQEDRVIFRAELCKLLNVGTECVRRWIKSGKLSTLHAAGIGLL